MPQLSLVVATFAGIALVLLPGALFWLLRRLRLGSHLRRLARHG